MIFLSKEGLNVGFGDLYWIYEIQMYFLSNLILRWVITSNFDIRYWSKNQMELDYVGILSSIDLMWFSIFIFCKFCMVYVKVVPLKHFMNSLLLITSNNCVSNSESRLTWFDILSPIFESSIIFLLFRMQISYALLIIQFRDEWFILFMTISWGWMILRDYNWNIGCEIWVCNHIERLQLEYWMCNLGVQPHWDRGSKIRNM